MLSIAPKPNADGTAKDQQTPTTTPSSTPAPMTNSASSSGGEENRDTPRRAASAVPSITGLRISPHGVEATLVNISESGVLAECGERLKPGSAVTVVFEGTFTPRSVEGRVARNTVSSMGKDGRLRYHVGIAFTKRISLGPDPADSAPEKPQAEGPVLAQPQACNRW
jgi:hypothetical protein